VGADSEFPVFFPLLPGEIALIFDQHHQPPERRVLGAAFFDRKQLGIKVNLYIGLLFLDRSDIET